MLLLGCGSGVSHLRRAVLELLKVGDVADGGS